MYQEFVVTNGSAGLAVRQSGTGPAVVLLHPGVADQRCWDGVAARLAKSHTVFTYDRRGFGATTYTDETHTSVADLIAILDAVEMQRVHLVGSSMGGRLAIEFALLEPDRAASLILLAAAIGGAPPPDEIPIEIDRLDSEIDRLEEAGDLDGANELEAQLWLDGPFRPPGTVAGLPRELFLEMNGLALRSTPTGEADSSISGSAWERLDELELPLLALVGAHDLPHLIARSQMVANRIRGAQFATLPRSAHLPHLDDPDYLAGLMGQFYETQ